MALLNVSGMSFGALSANAVLALNGGAARGGFAQDTGEGGLTRYHLQPGGDLIWELGSGYFGARTADGDFDPVMFAEKAAHDAVRCVELKLSQGAKPGIGGVLPAAKVNAEIAAARHVPVGQICVSPPAHRVFAHAPRAGAVPGPDARAGRRQADRVQAVHRLPGRRAGHLQGDAGRGQRRRTSSSSTGPRAAPAPPRRSTPTTSASRSPRA